ncbi:D-sedoheptulose-7-phosphate isomerase [Occallatibacter riparius]|uniref:SIS domain-containing protein n=1 Tax=Occallatibacter riparius TaxID=1002689 RepID=A0A9J7BU10_9BACT|nr:SIS domain-containing protein [Occallatibacter riparius]UWZ86128.1 SIS domain-containing protein [Occallatibacter riparius]
MSNLTASEFLPAYFEEYRRLAFDSEIHAIIERFAELAAAVRDRGGKLMFAGNGASASTSEHGAVDFTKQGKIRAITFHDPNLITCFANDYGYDNWMAKAIEHHAGPEDAVVLISVSGNSPSVVNAAKYAKSIGLPVVSFTGRKVDNPLKQLADIDFFVPSDAYNVVECIHCIWLTATIDLVIGKAVYETRAVALA